MKILSITTSSKICGVASLEDLEVIEEINLDNGLTHSEALMPLISKVLNESDLKLTDIDLIAVDIGPGSFTGIRIGISTVKAFADSLGIKTIGITALEVLSLNSKPNNVICTLVDAKKDNAYNEIFEFTAEQSIVRRNPSFDNIDSLLLELKNIQPEYDITFTGSGAIQYKDKILEYLPNSKFTQDNELSAKNVGLYAYAYSLIDTFPEIEPLYLRKSEAEQKLEEKQNGEK